MSVEIRRASQRLLERGPGRATHHSFSFGEAYDAGRLGLGPMVCHDDHRLQDGAGFEEHRHSGLDIVTWVVSGALRHTDAAGSVVLAPGEVGVLRARSGAAHTETAAAPQTRFVQVWLRSDETGEASYDVHPVPLVAGSLVEAVALPGGTFGVARLGPGDALTLPDSPLQHVFVARGALTRSSIAEPLTDGDAFEIRDAPGLVVTAAVPTELLVWSLGTVVGRAVA